MARVYDMRGRVVVVGDFRIVFPRYLFTARTYPGGIRGQSHLRGVRRDDIPELGKLLYGSFSDRLDRFGADLRSATTTIRRTLGGQWGRMLMDASFVHVESGRLVGAALVTLPYGSAAPLLAFLMVDRRYRRRGIGRQLLSRSIEAAAQQGFRFLCLVTNARNHPAITLYRKFGFRRHRRVTRDEVVRFMPKLARAASAAAVLAH